MNTDFIWSLWSTLACTRLCAYLLPESLHITYFIRNVTGINFHHAHFSPFLIILTIIALIYKLYTLANLILGIAISLALDQPYRTLPTIFNWLYQYKYWSWLTISIVISLHIFITIITILNPLSNIYYYLLKSR